MNNNIKGGNSSSEIFKPMQIIKVCIDGEKDKISWKNGSKTFMEAKMGGDFKNEILVPYF